MGILDGKVAIVTGGGRGIGAGEAMALAKEGAAVAIADWNFDNAVLTAKKIEEIGGRALPVKCDVRSREQVDAAVAATVERFGTVDILVNNAQIILNPHPLETWTEQEMRDMWDSGLLGSWFFMRACFPYMKEKGGRIINTTSVAGQGKLDGYVGYSTTKEATRSLTWCAAREWAKYGINVNTISPVAVNGQNLQASEEMRSWIFDSIGAVIRKFGDPEKDIGRSVVFLAGPDSNHITGCTLGVDGGSTMY